MDFKIIFQKKFIRTFFIYRPVYGIKNSYIISKIEYFATKINELVENKYNFSNLEYNNMLEFLKKTKNSNIKTLSKYSEYLFDSVTNTKHPVILQQLRKCKLNKINLNK